jgi:Family of unknown function (DUF6152)
MRPIRVVTVPRLAGAGACLLAAVLTASAHHSVTGIFDVTRTSTVTGTITLLEWLNPHSYLHVEVREANGSVSKYTFESLPPAMMRRAGVNRELFLGAKEVGQVVTIRFNPAKADPHEGWITRITYPDGHFYQLSPDTR